MKKIIPVLFLALFLAGCGSANKTYTYNDTYSGTDAQPETAAQPTKQTPMTNVPEQIDQTLAAQYSGAVLETNMGKIEVAFYPESPVTVSNFLTLAKKSFYDGTLFHRVIADFMIQGGDPNSKDADRSTHGMGGPDYKFSDEFNGHPLAKGSLAMANAGPGTNGSQFFIVTKDATPWLDGKHTNFGYVKSGMNVVEKIEKVAVDGNDHPVDDVKIVKIDLIKK